jgi:pyruvate formate lyase activating enzyme
MEAMYYEQTKAGLICRLCPHACIIGVGKTGICRVRRNTGGVLLADTWGKLSAINFDPVEKKPLYHFHPGKTILSLGSVGCSMKCQCCQNWQISQISTTDYLFSSKLDLLDIVKLAKSRHENIGVAFTYNEPTVWFEYMNDIAKLIRFEGLKNVMVSNGYINKEPLNGLFNYMDAFNIDLKGFSENFYRKFAGATLSPVLRTLKQIRKAGKHLEITFLAIPSLNDSPDEFGKMVSWIAEELGSDTVLHLSRYHPDYKLDVEPTSAVQLEILYGIAREKLSYVYVGNIQLKDYQDTRCSNCEKLVISRAGYLVNVTGLTDQGLCKFCGNQIIND